MTRTFCSICLHDHANVLVVDLHALQAIDLLHFVEQILLHRARSLDPQNVVRIDRTFGQTVAGAHAVALVHAQVLARRHLVQLCLARLVERAVVGSSAAHEDLALAALDLAEPHDAVDLGDRRRILRTARLEQLGDSRQTARDVARLVRLAADLGERRSRRRSRCPSSTVSCAPAGMMKSRTRFSFPPFSCTISMCGWSFFSRSSMMTRWRRPVSSSSSSDTDSSSTMSTKRTVPSTSARSGSCTDPR